MIKELWIDAYEDLVTQYLDEGLTEAEAEKRAENEAYDYMYDRLCDQADNLRSREKEQEYLTKAKKDDQP